MVNNTIRSKEEWYYLVNRDNRAKTREQASLINAAEMCEKARIRDLQYSKSGHNSGNTMLVMSQKIRAVNNASDWSRSLN